MYTRATRPAAKIAPGPAQAGKYFSCNAVATFRLHKTAIESIARLVALRVYVRSSYDSQASRNLRTELTMPPRSLKRHRRQLLPLSPQSLQEAVHAIQFLQ